MRHDLLAGAHHVQIKRIALVGIFRDEVAGLPFVAFRRRIAVGAPPRGVAGQGDEFGEHGLKAVSVQPLISYSFFNISDGGINAGLMRMCGGHLAFPLVS
ncbi:hypothetical protein D3C72_1813040 [compost metagenome]